MSDVHYEVVEHDGGWAYRVEGAYSETFSSKADAEAAARRAAQEQMLSGETEAISYQDKDGVWHEELASGSDRPDAKVD